MLELVKQLDLEILTPTGDNGIPVEMNFVDFRAIILDCPITINPDKLHSLITHYTKCNHKIDDQQLIKDLQDSESGDARPSTPKGISPKLVSLAKDLQDVQLELTSLVEPFDKTKQESLHRNVLLRFVSISISVNVVQIVMNLQTREIDSRKLQADLDSVQVQVPSDQCIPRRDDAIPDSVQSPRLPMGPWRKAMVLRRRRRMVNEAFRFERPNGHF
jgi:hypothetical protein